MKRILALAVAGLWMASGRPAKAEWLSLEGQPAQLGDIIQAPLKDLHPTQSAVGFDRNFYKLGRYARDRRKVFDEYCETNGQKGIANFSPSSDLHDPKTFSCLADVGTVREEMKTVVIAPDQKLYLTDGHHTFNAFWHMKEGGPELLVDLIVSRDYRDLPSMEDFWGQMAAEKNIWQFDPDGRPITPADLPTSLGLENFDDDSYRSLMYFARRIAWNNPGRIGVPEQQFFGDNYPDLPFVEFYWVREIRDDVDLSKYDLTKRSEYIDAIVAVGEAIVRVTSNDVGGSGKSAPEMGQFQSLDRRELARISRPGTGKLAYMLKFKTDPYARALSGRRRSAAPPKTSPH